MPKHQTPQRKNEANWIPARNRWQINVQREGIRKTFTSTLKGKKGKAEAEDRAAAWLRQVDPKGVSLTLEQMWPDFLAQIKANNSPSDYRQIAYHGRVWLLPSLGEFLVDDLYPGDWQDVLDDMYRAGRAKKTIQGVRSTVTRFYGYAYSHGSTMRKPDNLRVSKNAPEGEKQPLQPDQLQVLLSEDTDLYRGRPRPAFFIHAFRFAVLTALRRSEIVGLRLEDWDKEHNVLCVRRGFDIEDNQTKGKTKKACREVDLCAQAVAVLKAQRPHLLQHGLTASEWLFPDETGQRCRSNHLYNLWLNYRTAHGIDRTMHELRHPYVKYTTKI